MQCKKKTYNHNKVNVCNTMNFQINATNSRTAFIAISQSIIIQFKENIKRDAMDRN